MTALADNLRQLEDIVGAGHAITSTEGVSRFRLEGQQPLAVVSPGSREELAAVLRAATKAGLTVLVRGAGRHLHFGAPPGAIGVVLSTTRLNRVIEHDAENLTVTVEAGVTLGEVQRLVAAKRQVLPLDPPGTDEATLGGVTATNLAGPLRMRYGAPRDLVLGLRVALADGSLVKTGGKTVKNVAGYEVGKLFVGSLGSLGAICEVTVRLAPAAEARAMLAAALPPARAAEVSAHLLASRLDIATLDLCSHLAVRRLRVSLPITPAPDLSVVFIGLLGDRATISRQERELRQLIGAGCGRVEDSEYAAVSSALREVSYPRAAEEVVVRANVPQSRAADVAAAAAHWEGWWWAQRAGDGAVFIGAPVGLGEEELLAKLTALRKLALEAGGYLMLESAPVEVKRSFGVWGSSPHADLMRRVKESYDPKGTLGCGRFGDGL